jgi:hypothetical protein
LTAKLAVSTVRLSTWVGASIIALVAVSFILGTYQPRWRVPYTLCRVNVGHIHAAVMDYESQNGHLPPPYTTTADGKPLHSWRTLIAKHLNPEYSGLLRADESWNSQANRPLRESGARHFSCPGDRNKTTLTTSYLAVTGPGTAFDPVKRVSRANLPNDLIYLVEVTESQINWMEPADLDITTVTNFRDDLGRFTIGGNHHKGRFFVLFADFDVWLLDSRLPFEDLMKFFTIEGATKYDRDKTLSPFKVDYVGKLWP